MHLRAGFGGWLAVFAPGRPRPARPPPGQNVPMDTQYRAELDFDIIFSNGGSLHGAEFRIDIGSLHGGIPAA